MYHAFIAGVGGFIGTMLRYLVNTLVYDLLDFPTFPYGTFIINVSGCLVIGFLSGLALTREIFTPELRIFIFIGMLGGFTTFSSFGYETFKLMQDGQSFLALLNVFLHIFFGLSAVWLGYILSTTIR